MKLAVRYLVRYRWCLAMSTTHDVRFMGRWYFGRREPQYWLGVWMALYHLAERGQ